MQRPEAKPEPAEPNQRRWAMVRLVLGQAQIIGATMTLYFLVKTGESALTFWSAGITAAFTLTSRVLFKGRRGQPDRVMPASPPGKTPPAELPPHLMHLMTVLALLALLALFLYWLLSDQKNGFRWEDIGW